MAHRILAATEARIRLIPGDPASALAQTANSLARTDLVVISAGQDALSLAKAWFYVPRVLHPTSEVLIEELRPDGRPQVRPMSLSEISMLASAAAVRRVA